MDLSFVYSFLFLLINITTATPITAPPPITEAIIINSKGIAPPGIELTVNVTVFEIEFPLSSVKVMLYV